MNSILQVTADSAASWDAGRKFIGLNAAAAAAASPIAKPRASRVIFLVACMLLPANTFRAMACSIVKCHESSKLGSIRTNALHLRGWRHQVSVGFSDHGRQGSMYVLVVR